MKTERSLSPIPFVAEAWYQSWDNQLTRVTEQTCYLEDIYESVNDSVLYIESGVDLRVSEVSP